MRGLGASIGPWQCGQANSLPTACSPTHRCFEHSGHLKSTSAIGQPPSGAAVDCPYGPYSSKERGCGPTDAPSLRDRQAPSSKHRAGAAPILGASPQYHLLDLQKVGGFERKSLLRQNAKCLIQLSVRIFSSSTWDASVPTIMVVPLVARWKQEVAALSSWKNACPRMRSLDENLYNVPEQPIGLVQNLR